MVNISQETDAGIDLVIDGYRRLEKLDPQHDLLKYITNVNDRSFIISKKHNEELVDKFWPEKARYQAVMWAKYSVALSNAADKIEGIVKETTHA